MLRGGDRCPSLSVHSIGILACGSLEVEEVSYLMVCTERYAPDRGRMAGTSARCRLHRWSRRPTGVREAPSGLLGHGRCGLDLHRSTADRRNGDADRRRHRGLRRSTGCQRNWPAIWRPVPGGRRDDLLHVRARRQLAGSLHPAGQREERMHYGAQHLPLLVRAAIAIHSPLGDRPRRCELVRVPIWSAEWRQVSLILSADAIPLYLARKTNCPQGCRRSSVSSA